MREPILLPNDILECITAIESYTCNGRDTFLQTRMVQDAVVRNFEIIGEATKRLPFSLRQAYPDVPWKKMAGLRIFELRQAYPSVPWRRIAGFRDYSFTTT